jgi:ligand-binding SRPBCC domain-containing protein
LPFITLETNIAAPPERCFDLMRHPALHQTSNRSSYGGVSVALGQSVTFQKKPLPALKLVVIECDRPNRFVDAMVSGSFETFFHIHEFRTAAGGTVLRDEVVWESPFGMLGRIADPLIRRLLTAKVLSRNQRLKALVEAT